MLLPQEVQHVSQRLLLLEPAVRFGSRARGKELDDTGPRLLCRRHQERGPQQADHHQGRGGPSEPCAELGIVHERVNNAGHLDLRAEVAAGDLRGGLLRGALRARCLHFSRELRGAQRILDNGEGRRRCGLGGLPVHDLDLGIGSQLERLVLRCPVRGVALSQVHGLCLASRATALHEELALVSVAIACRETERPRDFLSNIHGQWLHEHQPRHPPVGQGVPRRGRHNMLDD
mmetsp:Transcript_26525/g.76343  ORF Transcript_26525/g.76343 Transcript_26525/m.76343 type:complete len:232 (-) Transcript_26525:1187-1882(-)